MTITLTVPNPIADFTYNNQEVVIPLSILEVKDFQGTVVTLSNNTFNAKAEAQDPPTDYTITILYFNDNGNGNPFQSLSSAPTNAGNYGILFKASSSLIIYNSLVVRFKILPIILYTINPDYINTYTYLTNSNASLTLRGFIYNNGEPPSFIDNKYRIKPVVGNNLTFSLNDEIQTTIYTAFDEIFISDLNTGIYTAKVIIKNDDGTINTNLTSNTYIFSVTKIIPRITILSSSFGYNGFQNGPLIGDIGIDTRDKKTNEAFTISTILYSGTLFDNSLYNSSSTRPTEAGNYSVTATISGQNYTGTASPGVNFSIDQINIRLKIKDPVEYTYNKFPKGPIQNNIELVLLSDDSTIISNSNITALNYRNTGGDVFLSQPIDADTYTLVVTISSNYKIGTIPLTFTIKKATPTIAISNNDMYTYNGTPQGPFAENIIVSPSKQNEVFTITNIQYRGTLFDNSLYNSSSTRPTEAGNYIVTVTINGQNYTGTASPGVNYTIAKIVPSINFVNILLKYKFNGVLQGPTIENIDVTPTFNPLNTSSSLKNAGILTLKYSGNNFESSEQPIEIGNYTINVTVSGNNYITSDSGAIFIIEAPPSEPICYNRGTKILSLTNPENKESYKPIEELRKGDLIKTYLHGYRRITHIGKRQFVNNPLDWKSCMYIIKKTHTNGLVADLLVTGRHSILVDDYTTCTNSRWLAALPLYNCFSKLFINTLNRSNRIDDKYLLNAANANAFAPLQDTQTYTYYHLVLEGEGEGKKDRRYGIWANGILSETTYQKDYLKHNFEDL